MKREAQYQGGKPFGHLTATWQLTDTLATIRRRFGAGSITLANSIHLTSQAAIPTGFPALDSALGIGGLPRGRIIDIYGPEFSGKTTLCLRLIAQAQRLGGRCLFIDTDCALDRDYIARCGVDVANLCVSQPANAEQALEIAEAAVRGGFAVVVIDSAAALVPRAEIAGDMGDEWIIYGSLMSQALRKLTGPVRRNNSILVFTNQIRFEPGALYWPEKITGGKALRSYASVRIELQSLRNIRKNGQVIGQQVRAVIRKNKVAPAFREAEIEMYSEG